MIRAPLRRQEMRPILALAFIAGTGCTSPTLSPASLEEIRHGTLVLEAGTLSEPVRMPRLGLGTAIAGAKQSQPSLVGALKMGFRLIDTAYAYYNAAAIRDAIAKSEVPRAEIFLVSKVWPFLPTKTKTKDRNIPAMHPSGLRKQFQGHLADLGVAYLDLVLLHWPSSRTVEHWKLLTELQREGRVRAIGICNVNTTHLEMIARAGLPPPSVVQNELSPVQLETRVTGSLEELISYCNQRGIVLMSHSPLKGAMSDPRAVWHAKQLGVSVSVLLLRYLLQRGFSAIFSSTSKEHIADNAQALQVELGEAAMRSIACWRGETPQCGRLVGSVGTQSLQGSVKSSNRVMLRRQLQQSVGTKDEQWRYPGNPLAPGELDPITCDTCHASASGGRRTLASGAPVELPAHMPVCELRAATRLDVAAPDSPSLGDIDRLQHRACTPGEKDGFSRMPCARLDVVQPCFEGECAHWARLIARLSSRAASLLDGQQTHWVVADQARFKGAQHIVKAPKRWYEMPGFDSLVSEMVHRHLRPHLARTVFGHDRYNMSTLGGEYPMLSRNRHLDGETLRTRSLLWHWDHVGPTQIKVLLYLTPVDRQHGCMVAMVHNVTGESYKLKGVEIRPFGYQGSTLPKLWIAQMMAKGYRPTCLAGPPGTAVIFDPNIVHRGSRPAKGNSRDFVLFLFDIVPAR